MKLGYLVPEFPAQTHIFFWREIEALEVLGVNVALYSTRRPTVSCPHAFAEPAAARTDYLMPPRPWEVAAALPKLPKALALARRAMRGTGQRLPKLTALALLGAVLAKRLKRAKVDHIHGHSAADVGYLLAFQHLLGGPSYSLTLHGDLDVYGDGHAFKFRHARFVTAVTDALVAQIAGRLPADIAPVHMIRMGVDLDGFTGWDRRDWSPAGTLRLATVARLDLVKGHVHAMEAIARLKAEGVRIDYDIVGQGVMLDDLREKAKALDLEDRITFHGALSAEAVVAVLLAADGFVLPSFGLGEAAPVSVMEAMGAGLPVVASIIGGTPEMICDGETGFLVPQKDVDALTGIFRRLAHDPALREQVGAAARAHAVTSFSTRSEAAKLHAAMRA